MGLRTVTMGLLVCVLLGVLAAAHAAREPLFSEYLARQQAPQAALSNYEDRETVCFHTSTICPRSCPSPYNSAPNWDCNAYNQIDHIRCAQCASDYADRDDDSSSFDKDLNIDGAQCFWYRHQTKRVKLPGTENVVWIGNFYGTCTIQAQGGACKLPETCNGVTVNIQGLAYYVYDAIRIGHAALARLDCSRLLARSEIAAGNFTEEVAPPTPGENNSPGTNKDGHVQVQALNIPSSGNVMHGPAYVYTGEAFVFKNGRLLPQFSHAHFQYSYFDGANVKSDPANTLGDVPRLGDEEHRFDFFPAQKPYYS